MDVKSKANNKLTGQEGQIGVIILLLTVVLLTIGLSISSRSITDIRLSRQEEQTSRAFDAAEAGIEEALRKDLQQLAQETQIGGPQTVNIGELAASYEVAEENVLETEIDEGETIEVNLEGLGPGDRVRVDWAKESCSAAAAIVVAVFDSDSVDRTPYDGCSSRASTNGFETNGVQAGSDGYTFSRTFNPSAGVQFMRIRAVHAGTAIRIAGDNRDLPVQFWRIHSEAQTELGQETRAVEVTQTLPAPPSIFDFVIYSGSAISK